MRDTSDVLTVYFNSELTDESALCVIGKYEGKTIMLKMELGEQADILYHLLTEQMTKAEIKALEQESNMEQFAKWVASEIFDDDWEYNKDAFDELACRKLAKLGIVRAKGDEWELVEPQESEE